MFTSLLAAVTNVFLTNPIWVLHARMAKSKDKVNIYTIYKINENIII
jgi:hypothetical protein